MNQLDCQRADQRRLPGRLGDDRVTRSQRRRRQSGEDGEREIPRGNSRDHSAAMQTQLVLLAGRSGKRHWPCELAPCFGSVEAQEVDRLPDLKDSVGQGLAAFADAERIEFLSMLLVKIGGPL